MAVRASLRYDDGFVPLNLVAVSDALRWARKTFPSRYTKTPAQPVPNNLRRRHWYAFPYKPTSEMFVLAEEKPEEELAPADQVTPCDHNEGLSEVWREPLRLIQSVSQNR